MYVATGFPRFADYPFRPIQAWLGVLLAGSALAMFHLTHRALGRNWSLSLEVREGHRLVTEGIYRHVRHPMYAAFWLWAVAQALLLPNWIAGFSGLIGFGTLYVFRVRSEERLMLDTFGEAYRAYMSRTARLIPWLH
jgi:protein-S-isoprenylcysteine O-methyltransferase Ste14